MTWAQSLGASFCFVFLMACGAAEREVPPFGSDFAAAGTGNRAGTGSAGQGAAASGAAGSSDNGINGTDAGAAANGGTQISSDLPCDVATVLRQHCQLCHTAPTRGGAPMPLLTRADLLAPAKSDASRRVIDLAVTRVNSAGSPMPPSPQPRLSANDIASLQTWLSDGTPDTGCTGTSPGSADAAVGGELDAAIPLDPLFDVAPMCSSQAYWTRGDHKDPDMHPGRACISCHQQNDGPSFAIGGTLFPTAHEPDDCYGAGEYNGDKTYVIITDATGRELSIRVDKSGNFSSDENDVITFPIHARVERAGAVRAMQGERMTGDCNSCHTEGGSNGAPGRIVRP